MLSSLLFPTPLKSCFSFCFLRVKSPRNPQETLEHLPLDARMMPPIGSGDIANGFCKCKRHLQA
jgi:hypothetical protein